MTIYDYGFSSRVEVYNDYIGNEKGNYKYSFSFIFDNTNTEMLETKDKANKIWC